MRSMATSLRAAITSGPESSSDASTLYWTSLTRAALPRLRERLEHNDFNSSIHGACRGGATLDKRIIRRSPVDGNRNSVLSQ